MWWLGFIFHEVAFGLLSVFIPLYIVSVGGSLIHIGIMSSAAIILSIPASLLWGYLCDKTESYKPYILLSFLLLAANLYAFTLTTDINLLIPLYVIMAFIHMAHEPPKNVLIAESFLRRDWERAYAFYEWVTEIGWLTGILSGFYAVIKELTAHQILLICSMLNFMAFLSSIFLIKDPEVMLERSLVRIERSVLFAYRDLLIALRPLGYVRYGGNTECSAKMLCFGLITFSVATRLLFTPLPIFLYSDLSLKQDIIYAIFCINSAGAAIGYFLLSRSNSSLSVRALYKTAAFRGVLSILLAAVVLRPEFEVALVAVVLFLMGLAYAIFHVISLSLSMELLPEKMTGIFYVVTGLGEALGSFAGPLMAEKLGFTYLFLSAGIIFFLTSISLRNALRS